MEIGTYCRKTGWIFWESGFRGILTIPIGISGFVFLTTWNRENPAKIGIVGMYEPLVINLESYLRSKMSCYSFLCIEFFHWVQVYTDGKLSWCNFNILYTNYHITAWFNTCRWCTWTWWMSSIFTLFQDIQLLSMQHNLLNCLIFILYMYDYTSEFKQC